MTSKILFIGLLIICTLWATAYSQNTREIGRNETPLGRLLMPKGTNEAYFMKAVTSMYKGISETSKQKERKTRQVEINKGRLLELEIENNKALQLNLELCETTDQSNRRDHTRTRHEIKNQIHRNKHLQDYVKRLEANITSLQSDFKRVDYTTWNNGSLGTKYNFPTEQNDLCDEIGNWNYLYGYHKVCQIYMASLACSFNGSKMQQHVAFLVNFDLDKLLAKVGFIRYEDSSSSWITTNIDCTV